MSRNKTNLKFQMFQELDKLFRPGTSKHKQQIINHENYKGYHSDYIHSYSTLNTYKDRLNYFSNWIKENHKDIKTINQLDKSIVKEYLQSEKASGKSAWTTHLELFAINKCLHENYTQKEMNISQRNISDITNNRNVCKHRQKDYLENINQIQFFKAFGFRRQSILNIKKSDFIYKDEKIIGLKIKEKGGKLNTYYCLSNYQNYVTNYLKDFDNNDKIFNQFDKNRHVNTHSFRNDYSYVLYRQLLLEKLTNQEYFNNSSFHQYINQNKVYDNVKKYGDYYKNYDTEILSILSQCLGHYRINVVVDHYLRCPTD